MTMASSPFENSMTCEVPGWKTSSAIWDVTSISGEMTLSTLSPPAPKSSVLLSMYSLERILAILFGT